VILWNFHKGQFLLDELRISNHKRYKKEPHHLVEVDQKSMKQKKLKSFLVNTQQWSVGMQTSDNFCKLIGGID